MDHVEELAEALLRDHRERHLADHLARVRGHDRGTEDLVAALLRVHAHEALFLAVGDGAVHLAERHVVGVELDAPGLRLVRVDSDVRHLGVGVGTPRHRERRQLLGAEEQRVLDHDLGGRVGRVCELPRHADVARGVDAGIAGLEIVVHVDAAFRVVAHADRLEVEPLDVGRAADAEQELVHHDAFGPAVAVGEPDRPRGAVALDALDRAPVHHADALGREARLDDPRGVLVLARQDVRVGVQHGHLAAEPAERLGQLAADRPRADHAEPARPLGEVEHRLVGQEAGLLDALDRQRDRARAGRDHRLLEAHQRAADRDRVPAREARVAEEHVDAELVAVARRGIVVADLRADPAHALHRGAEVGLGAVGERESDLLLRAPRLGHHPRGAEHALAGHAADVQAVAAEIVALDQRHLRAQPGRDRRRDQARGSAADHDEVVALRGRGIAPRGRVDVFHEPLVVRVHRRNQGDFEHEPS